MAIATEELAGGILKVVLKGRLDLEGVAAMDLELEEIAGTRKAVLVDVQNVIFLGSVAVRALVIPARTMKGRGGKMVLFGPNEMVQKVLKTSGADTLIPVHHDLHTALSALQFS